MSFSWVTLLVSKAKGPGEAMLHAALRTEKAAGLSAGGF
jgi:hypothetical protein